jgi:hypothetical protein
MNQHWRIPMILCLSVVLGAPALGRMVQTPTDLTTWGGRYLAALALAWVGVSGIARMIEGFDLRNRIAEHEQLRSAAAAEE